VVLWAYKTACKKLTRQTPFRLVYGQEAVMLMEYIVLSLRIIAITDMSDSDMLKERMSQILALEEEKFIAGFDQKVQNKREKT